MNKMEVKPVKSVFAQILIVLGLLLAQIKGQPLVPALILFGDSSIDAGNNIYIPTLFKANYSPYGRDFPHHLPTGRFCNGKLAPDITAETLGFTSFPAAYLSPQASGKNLLIGANFGSSAAGFDDRTSNFNELHGLGARRIGVISVPPHGCNPALIATFGSHDKPGCIKKINDGIQIFNKKINSTVTQLSNKLNGVKLAVLDVYKPYYDLVHSPRQYGFTEARRGCCGTGRVKDMSFMCKPGTRSCRNASEYVFWDGVHLTEAANQFLVDEISVQAIKLVT